MWEIRAAPGALDDLVDWVFDVALVAAGLRDGYEGSDVFRSDEQDRVVVITRWAAATADLPEPPEELAARPAYSWDFEPVHR
jgi:hypothetical protein